MHMSFELIEKILIGLLSLSIVTVSLIPMVLAAPIEPDIYDQWNTIEEFEEVSSLRKFLIEKNWSKEDLSVDELDYILVLIHQCSSEFFPTVPTSLVLAMISVESEFDRDLVGSYNDTGLMQVIPRYHRDRIEKYIYDENIDLHDPRLNIMVGMDFLEELFEEGRGDIEYVVMAYNMGPIRAWKFYDMGIVSSYAEKVLERMDAIQDFFEGRYGNVRNECR